MAYHQGRKSIREIYEENFSPMDAREVTVHRVVNIVEKRSSAPQPAVEYERGYDDNSYYSGPDNYQGGRGYYNKDGIPPKGRRYHDENLGYGGFHKHNSPQRNEDSYSQQYYSRDDLRYQLSSRNRSRSHYTRKRGRGFGPSSRDDQDYRSPKSLVITWERSPPRKEAETPAAARSRSNSSNRSFSPDRNKGYAFQQQQQKQNGNVVKSQTPSSSAEESPHSPVSFKETMFESSLQLKEAAVASVEPKQTLEEDLKNRRWDAINTKVLEIEKHYRQDCETFRTVVKMLVSKEPSLETLLQTSLDKNLLEIRQRCLKSLKNFVSELDEILEQPDNSG